MSQKGLTLLVSAIINIVQIAKIRKNNVVKNIQDIILY